MDAADSPRALPLGHPLQGPRPGLTPQELWLVALGAPLTALDGGELDGLRSSGGHDDRLRAGIRKAWGIKDRASFQGIVRWLIDEGQRDAYFKIWEAIVAMDQVRRRGHPLLKLFAPALVEVKAHRGHNVHVLAADTGVSVEALTEKFVDSQRWSSGIAQTLGIDVSAIRSFLAWDAVRLVNVARWGLQLGWIERDEFVGIAGALASQVQAAYVDWSQVSACYVLAGLVWNYSEAREQALLDTRRRLLQDANSPMRKTVLSVL